MGAKMDKASFGAAALLLALPTAVQAQGGGERLVSPALPGFVVGHNAANAQQSIKEEVPKGETVQGWSRMVTTQRFSGLAARATPSVFAANVTAGLPQSCPGAKVTPVTALTVSGRKAARFQADCPKGTGGRPETFLLLAVAGASDMHVKQVAFSGAKTAADLAWARNFLASTVVCTAGDKSPACRN